MRQWTGSALIQIMACRLFSAKLLRESMMTYFQLEPEGQLQWNSNQNTNLSFTKTNLKCRLRSGVHFVRPQCVKWLFCMQSLRVCIKCYITPIFEALHTKTHWLHSQVLYQGNRIMSALTEKLRNYSIPMWHYLQLQYEVVAPYSIIQHVNNGSKIWGFYCHRI